MASSCHQASGEPCEKTQDLNNWLDKDSVAKFLTPSTDLLAAFPLHAASWRQGTKSLYSPPLVSEPAALLLNPPHWRLGGGGVAEAALWWLWWTILPSVRPEDTLVAPGPSAQQETTLPNWAVLSSYFIFGKKMQILSAACVLDAKEEFVLDGVLCTLKY